MRLFVAIVLLLALAALPFVPAQADMDRAAWSPLPEAAPHFLSLRLAASATPPALSPPTLLLGLPTSVFAHQDSVCSTVDATRCSVDASTPDPGWCSAHCDELERCSVIELNSANAGCSTLGGMHRACSVLPGGAPSFGPATCSIFDGFGLGTGGLYGCSVLEPGRKQFCSAVNPNTQGGVHNRCSTFDTESDDTFRCSVIGAGGPNASGICRP